MYRASGFQSGLDVTGRLYDVASLDLIETLHFDEMDTEPVYYADVTLPCTGKYLLMLLHSGVRAASTVIDVRRETGVVYYNA